MFPFPRVAAMLAALFAAACASTPPIPSFAEIRFTDKPPIRLDVARIDIVEAYRPPLKPPNVEHLFPVRPPDAARQWARDRLRPAGATGWAEAIIRNASVTETALERTEGIRGAFTTDQTERYDAEISIAVRIFDDAGNERAYASATARGSRTVAEDITLNDRERAWYRMTAATMRALDEALEGRMRKSLAEFLK